MGNVSFSYYADKTFAELEPKTFAQLSQASSICTLTASMCLAPLSRELLEESNHIIDAQLTAYAEQFSKLHDAVRLMGITGKIDYCEGTDLDERWGKVYQLYRRAGESDEEYRYRLMVYIRQLVGSGTKRACEEIISLICEKQNCCRIDTYWPAYCRIYITDQDARIKARARTNLINLIAPEMLAAGVTYRFYIPYYDLQADIILHGPVYNELPADMFLGIREKKHLDAAMCLGSVSYFLLDSDLILSASSSARLKARVAFQGISSLNLSALERLCGISEHVLDASVALKGSVYSYITASQRRCATNIKLLEATMPLSSQRLRPIEARGYLAEGHPVELSADVILA